jgi:hypothetical protein
VRGCTVGGMAGAEGAGGRCHGHGHGACPVGVPDESFPPGRRDRDPSSLHVRCATMRIMAMVTCLCLCMCGSCVPILQQPRMVGSLVRTMVEFSLQTTGMPLAYIELSQGAVARGMWALCCL